MMSFDGLTTLNRFKLNSLKCKELRIDFRRENNLDTVPLEAKGNVFEIVKSAKILGVTVRNDLKWIDHVDETTMKASRRINLLKQLKCAGIDRKSLILFYCACIRSVLEYACQASHTNLPAYLFDQIERVQKRVLRILFPEVSNSKTLEDAGLTTLFHRREELCSSLFKQIVESDQHKLAGLLPAHNDSERYNFRTRRMFSILMHFATKEQL